MHAYALLGLTLYLLAGLAVASLAFRLGLIADNDGLLCSLLWPLLLVILLAIVLAQMTFWLTQWVLGRN